MSALFGGSSGVARPTSRRNRPPGQLPALRRVSMASSTLLSPRPPGPGGRPRFDSVRGSRDGKGGRRSSKQPSLQQEEAELAEAAAAEAQEVLAAELRKLQRKANQILTRQGKARTAIQTEEQQAFDECVFKEASSRSSIDAFVRFRQAAEEAERHRLASRLVWQSWLLGEREQEVMEQETEHRRAVERGESELRDTLRRIYSIDTAPLLVVHALGQVVKAEEIRRMYLVGDEKRTRLALEADLFAGDIGRSHKKGNSVPGSGGAAVRVGNTVMVNLMGPSHCPFRYAEDCPFFPVKETGATRSTVKRPTIAARQCNAHTTASATTCSVAVTARGKDRSYSASRNRAGQTCDAPLGSAVRMTGRSKREHEHRAVRRKLVGAAMRHAHYATSESAVLSNADGEGGAATSTFCQ